MEVGEQLNPSNQGEDMYSMAPQMYDSQVLRKTVQLIHYLVVQMSTHKRFYITFIYGMKHEHQRQPMWEDLLVLSQQINEAWCIIRDYNAVLYREDRIGGNEIQGTELKELTNFMEQGDLQEMRWSGTYYTWTDKIIWSRIDRALINIYWYDAFDFTQNHYLANGLSNHSLMMLYLPLIAKPRSRFQFCEMWTKHRDFNRVVDSVLSPVSIEPLNQLKNHSGTLKISFK